MWTCGMDCLSSGTTILSFMCQTTSITLLKDHHSSPIAVAVLEVPQQHSLCITENNQVCLQNEDCPLTCAKSDSHEVQGMMGPSKFKHFGGVVDDRHGLGRHQALWQCTVMLFTDISRPCHE